MSEGIGDNESSAIRKRSVAKRAYIIMIVDEVVITKIDEELFASIKSIYETVSTDLLKNWFDCESKLPPEAPV